MDNQEINHSYNTRSKKRQSDSNRNSPKNVNPKFRRVITDDENKKDSVTNLKLNLDKFPNIMIFT